MDSERRRWRAAVSASGRAATPPLSTEPPLLLPPPPPPLSTEPRGRRRSTRSSRLRSARGARPLREPRALLARGAAVSWSRPRPHPHVRLSQMMRVRVLHCFETRVQPPVLTTLRLRAYPAPLFLSTRDGHERGWTQSGGRRRCSGQRPC
jgi:hypothetical protein